MHSAEVMEIVYHLPLPKLVYHLAALGTAHYCLAVVAFTREQCSVRRSRNGMHGVVVLKLLDHLG